MDYVLDACALIALLNDEDGADTVGELLTRAKGGFQSDCDVRLFMSGIQVMEVYYDRIYVMGREFAETVIEEIYSSPIKIMQVSRSIIREAGRFKTSYSMSLADSFAAATAKNIGATLVTKDEEMRAAEKAREFYELWLK
jgi:predicted nucleic acid-binding protein